MEVELRCSRRVGSSCYRFSNCCVTLATNPVIVRNEEITEECLRQTEHIYDFTTKCLLRYPFCMFHLRLIRNKRQIFTIHHNAEDSLDLFFHCKVPGILNYVIKEILYYANFKHTNERITTCKNALKKLMSTQ
jgi:hypothetical protein